ncbi:alpha/beta hydrolase [Aldersonia sp. NBC_00410]|uniref:alpha/beta fold hydrolase n=1 Tax=Aldersonia sp. NBC_00410 TaxID=2975954 RepID=UPI00224E5F75|nr:alpha/beta fold hydrolase [Aldersonia sp. NBC_00410]MCX5045268.1 alpha/beta hydrolase [Aldersonia sp. NBC_00410]
MGMLDGLHMLFHLARGNRVAEDRQTTHTTIDDRPHRVLRRYGTLAQLDAARAAGAPAVLLIPPLAVSARCYDLAPGMSLVEHLLDTGRVPYVVDFGDMTYADRHLGFEDFFDDIVPGAILAVLDDHGCDEVDLVAWSIGGTIALMATAAHADLPVRSITGIGTPLDYSRIQPYPLAKQLTKPTGGKAVTLGLRSLGGIPAPLVRIAYRATAWQRELRKPQYIVRNADNLDALARMQVIDRFQETMPGYPGRVAEQMWENLIYRDEIASGVLRFGERTVDLTSIAAPIQLFGSHRDAIVSWPAAYHGVEIFTGSAHVEFATVETSHLGLLAGADAAAFTWPRIDDFLASLDRAVVTADA